MDTSSSARYQLSNKRTLNGTLCRIAASSRSMPRAIFVRNCWCNFLKSGSSTKTGSTSLWRRARSLRFVGMGRSGKCLWTNSAQRVHLHSADTTGGRRESARDHSRNSWSPDCARGDTCPRHGYSGGPHSQTDCRRVHTRCHPGSVPNQRLGRRPPCVCWSRYSSRWLFTWS